MTTALVVGAGVIGLTTAIRLAERGVPTTIWTADPPEATTSHAAGASWGLHLVTPDPAVTARARTTLRELRAQAEHPDTGVRITTGTQASRSLTPPPEWGLELADFRPCTDAERPPGYPAAWRCHLPLIEMPRYLAYLGRRFEALGGTVLRRRIDALDEATAVAQIVVNATGIGAARLGDRLVTPIRGQVVIVENPGVTEFFCEDPTDSPDLLYYFPHGATVLLGGTAGTDDDRLTPDPATARAIVARCATVDPRLADARVLAHRVGLRPSRPQVRLEVEHLPSGGRVVHNYGHGGSGVTLAWGYADDATDLALSS